MAYLGRKGQTAPLASADLPTNSISTAHLINDAVTSAKIGVDVIVAEDIANNAVTVAEIADDAVTADKLANSINTAIAANTAKVSFTPDAAQVFNDTGADVDFRVEASGEANALFVQGSDGNVGIGTSAPESQLMLLSEKPTLIFHDNKTTVNTEDLGKIQFHTADSSMPGGIGAEIRVLATNGYGDRADILFSTAENVTSLTERMRINSSGNVGINEATPTKQMHITHASWASMALEGADTGGGYIDFMAGSSEFRGRILMDNQSATTTDGQMQFFTGGNSSSVRMNISPSGNVGMGEGYTAGTNGFMFYSASDALFSRDNTSTRTQITFANPNGAVGTVTTNGSATSFNTSSDYRLKENVVPMSGSIDRLKSLKPSRFNFIADADKTVDGFLAHEAQTVVPESVSGEKDAMTEAVLYAEGDELPEGKSIGDVKTAETIDPQGIDQSKLVPLLVGALQEAITRIETLENA